MHQHSLGAGSLALDIPECDACRDLVGLFLSFCPLFKEVRWLGWDGMGKAEQFQGEIFQVHVNNIFLSPTKYR